MVTDEELSNMSDKQFKRELKIERRNERNQKQILKQKLKIRIKREKIRRAVFKDISKFRKLITPQVDNAARAALIINLTKGSRLNILNNVEEVEPPILIHREKIKLKFL